MEYRKEDVFVFQLVNYFVKNYSYQIVSVKQQKDDIWLINQNSKKYPVIRLSTKPSSEILNELDYIRSIHRILLDLTQREGQLLMFTMDHEAQAIDNEMMKVISIAPAYLSNQEILKDFPNIEKQLHDVDNNQEEMALLTKSLEEFAMKRKKFKLPNLKQIPKITLVMMLLCIVMTIITTILTYQSESLIGATVISGAYYKMNVLAANEFWRFFTAPFVHVDFFQLLLNVYVLYQISTVCERLYSKTNYMLIILSSVVLSSFFILIAGGNDIFVGIGGVIFGTLGAYMVSLWTHGGLSHPLIKANLLKLVLMACIITIGPGSSWVAHVGGFIGGALMSVLLIKEKKFESFRNNVFLASCALMGVLAYMTTTSLSIEPIVKSVDREIISSCRKLGLNDYATYLNNKYKIIYQEEMAK
ncbi:MAG: rhomboid family intramembrane serine protease [Erysipelotrichaceae bacterium]